MLEWLQILFSTDGFMPHGHCYLWKPELLIMHVGSDILTFLSYAAIPFALAWFARKRTDLPFSWVFVLFSIFIIACGFTHLLAVVTVWQPIYWLTAVVKVITAVASVLTAIVLFPLLPKALALPSPSMLQTANDELTLQMAERLRVEAEIVDKNAELQTVNDALSESLENLKQMQEQLIIQEKMASLGGLVAGVAHEINTPLGIGVTATSYIKDKTDELIQINKTSQLSKGQFDDYLSAIKDSSGMVLKSLLSASTLISSFKKIAVDQNREEKQKIIIKQHLENVLISLKPKLKQAHHTVIINCSNELQLTCFSASLMQVFTNLVSNSLLQGFDDGEAGCITINIEEQGNKEVLIKYHDNGKGISEENKKKIFDPFFTTKRNKGGVGLGLHVIYNMVTQNMGGSVSVESMPGEGTTFLILLPNN
ncbi:MAG: HAMP domain-containing histidine kinase [Oleispira sp.]|nr:HAMP domain-containing histidine kinase [Oleispira sp.]